MRIDLQLSMPENQSPSRPVVSRRQAIQVACVASAAAVAAVNRAPGIQTVRAANDQVHYGFIGTGSRGSYLLGHLKNIDNGRYIAVCDKNHEKLDQAYKPIGRYTNKIKDYRQLLER